MAVRGRQGFGSGVHPLSASGGPDKGLEAAEEEAGFGTRTKGNVAVFADASVIARIV